VVDFYINSDKVVVKIVVVSEGDQQLNMISEPLWGGRGAGWQGCDSSLYL
jgi:hypothetical protein